MTIQEWLAKNFESPCNFSPLDEDMVDYCCENYKECNCLDDIECWDRVIKAHNITNVLNNTQQIALDIWNAVKTCISSISGDRGKEYEEIIKYNLKDIFKKYGVDINDQTNKKEK